MDYLTPNVIFWIALVWQYLTILLYQISSSAPLNNIGQYVPTGISKIIATQIVDRCFQPGTQYYKVGIGLLDLSSAKNKQEDLFAPITNPALMNVYDQLNNKYGRDAIFVAAQGIAPKWGMRRDRLTPQYTTKWNDLPKIKC